MVDQQDISSELANDAFGRQVQKRLAITHGFGRLCTLLGIAMLAIMAVLALGTTVVPRALGLHTYAVVSGSMEPEYPTGSLVYTKSASASGMEPGVVAAFWHGEDVIVHRVVENDGVEKELVTKGDANEAPDPWPVPYTNVLGQVIASVPYVGYLLIGVSTLTGKLVLGWILLMAVAFCVVGTILNNLTAREPL